MTGILITGGTVLDSTGERPADVRIADGLVSDAGGQSLWVCGADCTPVLIADRRRGAVAACHAGWRGVATRILPAALELLVAAGSRREDLLVALGPAVAGARYQVRREVSLEVGASLQGSSDVTADSAAETTADPAGALASLQACGALGQDPEPGRDRLDIRAAARRQLESGGVPPGQIAVCPLCTVAEVDLFHSWRRDQVKAVQWSGIVAQG